MTDNDATIRLCQLSDDVIAVEIYIRCGDLTIDWYPSLHNGEIDADVVQAQVRAHHGRS